jgi:hypothetical protein
MHHPFSSMTIYLGSGGYCRDVFKDAAAALGRDLAEQGVEIVYGGMDAGLMGLLARHGRESGGAVTGILPRSLKDSERVYHDLSETVLVDSLWQRKQIMFERGGAVIAMPGGFGTLDEALEVLYWGISGYHAKPLVMVNIDGYWDDILAYLYDGVRSGTLAPVILDYLIVIDNTDELTAALVLWEQPRVQDPRPATELPHFEETIMNGDDTSIIIESGALSEIYRLFTALTLTQLGANTRPIGVLDETGFTTPLLAWMERAEDERFLTPHCRDLFSVADNMPDLRAEMETHEAVTIDLHKEKWGGSL